MFCVRGMTAYYRCRPPPPVSQPDDGVPVRLPLALRHSRQCRSLLLSKWVLWGAPGMISRSRRMSTPLAFRCESPSDPSGFQSRAVRLVGVRVGLVFLRARSLAPPVLTPRCLGKWPVACVPISTRLAPAVVFLVASPSPVASGVSRAIRRWWLDEQTLAAKLSWRLPSRAAAGMLPCSVHSRPVAHPPSDAGLLSFSAGRVFACTRVYIPWIETGSPADMHEIIPATSRSAAQLFKSQNHPFSLHL